MVEIEIIKEEYSKFKISFSYNPIYLKRINTFKGSWWYSKKKSCTVPYPLSCPPNWQMGEKINTLYFQVREKDEKGSVINEVYCNNLTK